MVDGLSTGNDGGGDDGQEHPGKLSCDFEGDGDDGLGVSDVGKGPFPTTRANILLQQLLRSTSLQLLF